MSHHSNRTLKGVVAIGLTAGLALAGCSSSKSTPGGSATLATRDGLTPRSHP